MGPRRQRLLSEAGRFLAVGGLATIVALVLFNLLVHGFNTGAHALLDDKPILAYVLANTVGMVISYRGTRQWAFRDRPTRHADGGRSAFVVINVVTMAIPVLCLFVSRDLLGLDDPLSDNIAANVIGLALGVAARFWLFRTLVFRRPINLGDIYPAESARPLDPGLGPEGDEVPGAPLSEQATKDRSRSGPTPPPALGGGAG
ncbi:GtrA-like protein [Nocardioides dokdonensis FR1436]|uniref:GtrA-like protein n=1 Tax=Nocardioides dokdonensis FR1436 TaxID=1300347 RepID=A0A1A9GG97_9ACTN|nr:GtrA family protein [Nocardioides dokdonensis]ANH36643.1 GtrA-like protein [Nocardioides dokdonensis FR1436]